MCGAFVRTFLVRTFVVDDFDEAVEPHPSPNTPSTMARREKA
jgi:hypothetical protein